MAGKIRVTQVRSAIANPQKLRRVLVGMGLTRREKTVVLEDTPSIRGMVRKVQHLVRVEKVEE